MVDGISGWAGWMTVAAGCASGWLDIEGLYVGAVGANCCGGDGSGAASWIRDFGC